ncbi:hypothetical protein HPB47_027266, partial [Ixodes persulcatus]
PRASASERALPSDSTSGHRSERTWDVWLPQSSFGGPALSEEKGFAQRNEIKKICYKNNVTRDKKAVERAFVERHRNLLERLAPIDEGFEFELLSLTSQLEKNACNRLKEPISVWELEKAIDELSSGKTNGPDGL